MRRNMLCAMATLCAALMALPTARAQSLDGPLRIVVGYAPGGAADRGARLLADGLKDKLGVPVLVENKTGAGGRLSAQLVKATPPDQNVLLMGNPAIAVVAPLVASNVGYDPRKDFVPLSQIARYDFGIAVGPAVPVRELTHLLAWLRANPNQANIGVPATGSLPHFFALMLADSAKVSAQVVGYRGSAPLITDLIGGQIPVAVDTLDSLLPAVQSGKLRILAVGASQRSPQTGNLPTMREAGYEAEFYIWSGVFAPAGLPAEVLARVRGSVKEAVADAGFIKAMSAMETPIMHLQGAEFDDFLQRDSKRLADVIRRMGKLE